MADHWSCLILRASDDPGRIFRVTTELARQAGLVRVRRELNSAPLLTRPPPRTPRRCCGGAIRGVLRACSPELAALVRAGLERDDNYAAAGKPVCDWGDPQARERLVDGLFTLERAAAYAAVGADCLFVAGLIDPAAIAELAAGLLRVAVMVWAGVPTGLELAAAGVVRFSLGSAVAQAARAVAARATRELVVDGTTDEIADDKTRDALAGRLAIQEAR